MSEDYSSGYLDGMEEKLDELEPKIKSLRDRISELEEIQEHLIQWVQHDCPFSRDQILDEIAREMASSQPQPCVQRAVNDNKG
jgi:hypothetical protein